MNCGVGCKRGLDPVLLWLWPRPTAAALIQLLAWELPYAADKALKRKKKKKKERKEREERSVGDAEELQGIRCSLLCFH